MMLRLLPLALCMLTGCALYDLIPQPEEESDMSTQADMPIPGDPCSKKDSNWATCSTNSGEGQCFGGICQKKCAPRDRKNCEDHELCAATFRTFGHPGPFLCVTRDVLDCANHKTELGTEVEPDEVCKLATSPGSRLNLACLEDADDGWSCRPTCITNLQCKEGRTCEESMHDTDLKGCVKVVDQSP